MSTTTTSIVHHGQSTQNKTREQERQSPEEIWRQVCNREGSEEQRKKPRVGEGKRQYCITIENASNVRKTFLAEVKTTEELEQYIQDKETSLCHPSIGFLFSASRFGSTHHSYFSHDIPDDIDTIYVRLYLKKHTAFYPMKN